MEGKASALYLQRAESGGWELVTAEGEMVVQGGHYRELRKALGVLTAGWSGPAVRILVGAPRERRPAGGGAGGPPALPRAAPPEHEVSGLAPPLPAV
jgi:hypothetical protein